MLIQSKQDRESLSALTLVYLCPVGPTSCSCKPFPSKTRNLSLLPAHTVFARQGPLPGQLAQCILRTIPPNLGLVNPESFMEASWSAGALLFCLKLERVAPLIADSPLTSSTTLPICASGGGGVTEQVQVEALVKDWVGTWRETW